MLLEGKTIELYTLVSSAAILMHHFTGLAPDSWKLYPYKTYRKACISSLCLLPYLPIGNKRKPLIRQAEGP